jgi:hypothetical protein
VKPEIKIYTNLILSFLFVSITSFAQNWKLELRSNVDLRNYKLTNHSEASENPLPGASIKLYKGTTLLTQVSSNVNGDFNIMIPANGEYIVEISYPNCVSKRLAISTTGVPPEVGTDDYKPVFSIDGGFIMAKSFPGVDYSGLQQPLIKIVYNPKKKNFIDDESSKANGLSAVSKIYSDEEAVFQKFCASTKAGDDALKKSDCPKAKTNYQNALTIIPAEPYPLDQIAKADQCMKDKDDATKKAEEEKLAKEKAATDKAAADKLAADKAATDKATADKEAADKVVADKLAKEESAKKAADEAAARKEADRMAAEKITADKAAADKLAADKVAADKVAKDKADAEKTAADKLAAEKAAADKMAKDKAEADKTAAEKLAKEEASKKAADEAAAKKEADKLAADKVAKDKVEADKIAAEKTAADKVAKEKAVADKAAADKANKDKTAKEKADADKLAKADAAKKTADEAAAKKETDRIAAEKTAADKATTEKMVKETKEKETLKINATPTEENNAEFEKGKAKNTTRVELGADKYKETIARANDLFKMKRYEEAKPIYEDALKCKPDDAFAKTRLEQLAKLLAPR